MRRALVLLLVLVVLVGGGSYGLWAWTVARMQAGFDAWSADAAAQGWMIRTGAPRHGGWPLGADLDFTGLSLSAGPDMLPGGASYTAQRAVLHLSPLAPEVLELRLLGVQRVQGFGSAALLFTAQTLTLTLPLRGKLVIAVAGKGLRFDAPAEGTTIGLLSGTIRPGAAPEVDLSAEAIALPPPPAPQPALGRRIASATIRAALEGTLPPPSPDPLARLVAWQRDGGLLRVQHLTFGWGPLGLTGTAALGLDAALQPQGTATLRVVGYDPALSALAAGGAITPQAAQAVRAVLALLARAPEEGGVPQVVLPLTLSAGVVRVGRIPIGKVPKVDWSAAP